MSMKQVPTTMQAVLLTGHGGFDKLDIRDDVAVPSPSADQVLIKVLGAGVNNTDINTRIGWYSKNVTEDTNAGGDSGFASDNDDDGSWAGEQLNFPRVQGGDCCGVIVAVGESVDKSRVGERVIVRTVKATGGPNDVLMQCTGSEVDGAFAEYMVTESKHALAANCDWTDVELASLPCAYSTAEGMLHRANVGAENVLITGASGGVGSAAIQLAKRRGATVIAITSTAKFDEVLAIGADQVLDRDDDLVAALGQNNVDVVVDLVAGPNWPPLLDVLKRGGRYVTSGAIAGPMVELDVRTLYLKDLSLLGSTFQPDVIFENLVKYVEAGDIKPLVAKTYPLVEIVSAQQDFLEKKYTGKLVLIPGA